jgi:hypothetical protein
MPHHANVAATGHAGGEDVGRAVGRAVVHDEHVGGVLEDLVKHALDVGHLVKHRQCGQKTCHATHKG